MCACPVPAAVGLGDLPPEPLLAAWHDLGGPPALDRAEPAPPLVTLSPPIRVSAALAEVFMHESSVP
jgi:hypothetical protein